MTDLNDTIAELARTTPHGYHEIAAIAAVYPDAEFLRFAVSSWGSSVRLSATQLAEVFCNPIPLPSGEHREQDAVGDPRGCRVA